MTKTIKCQSLSHKQTLGVKVRVIKAPLVDTAILRQVVTERLKAVVL